jgi:ribosomal protein L37AE/L43A
MMTPSEMTDLPDGPQRCIACPSAAVSIVVVDGHPVWCCTSCERLFVRPAVATGSRGRVF